MTGTAVSAPLVTSILSGCSTQVDTSGEFTPSFFRPGEFDLVSQLADAILPKTDSPAATEVGVDRIIDGILSKVYESEDQAAYREGFAAMTSYLQAAGYDTMDSNGQLEVLRTLETSEGDEAARDAFRDLKQQTVAFYLSTEEVSKDFLNYLPVPGPYEACIPLSDVENKAWAL